MPTKTKPRRGMSQRGFELSVPPEFSREDRDELARLLGLRGAKFDAACESVLHAVRSSNFEISERLDEPLDANLAAELKPVVRAANSLSRRLQLSSKLQIRIDGERTGYPLAAETGQWLDIVEKVVADEGSPSHAAAQHSRAVERFERVEDAIYETLGITKALSALLAAWLVAAEKLRVRLDDKAKRYQTVSGRESSDGGSDGGTRNHKIRRVKDSLHEELIAVYQREAAAPSPSGRRKFLSFLDDFAKRPVTLEAKVRFIDSIERG